MSKTLPWRTLATPLTPSDRSAPSMALPCGSRMPDFSVTVTRAFMLEIPHSPLFNRHRIAAAATATPLLPVGSEKASSVLPPVVVGMEGLPGGPSSIFIASTNSFSDFCASDAVLRYRTDHGSASDPVIDLRRIPRDRRSLSDPLVGSSFMCGGRLGFDPESVKRRPSGVVKVSLGGDRWFENRGSDNGPSLHVVGLFSARHSLPTVSGRRTPRPSFGLYFHNEIVDRIPIRDRRRPSVRRPCPAPKSA